MKTIMTTSTYSPSPNASGGDMAGQSVSPDSTAPSPDLPDFVKRKGA